MTEHAGTVLIVAVSFPPALVGLLVWAIVDDYRRAARRQNRRLTALGLETPAEAKARRRAIIRAADRTE